VHLGVADLGKLTSSVLKMLGIHIEKMGPFAVESDKSIAVAREILGPEAYTAAELRGTRRRRELSEVQRLAPGRGRARPQLRLTGALARSGHRISPPSSHRYADKPPSAVEQGCDHPAPSRHCADGPAAQHDDR
jgi:hypothetical protein